MSGAGIIRDKAFAKRIAQACADHPRAPSGHGQQIWVRRSLIEIFDTTVSPEGIRKWFAGEARPRPKMMSHLAQLLGVDEAWLSLGITPASEPGAKQRINAMANGALNLVAGQIQLAGGTIAFPEEDAEHDMFAIIKGKQVALSVKLAPDIPRSTLAIASTDKPIIAVVPTADKTIFRFFRVPNDLVETHGKNRGGYVEVEIEIDADKAALVAGQPIPEILDFRDISGCPTSRIEND